MTKSEDVRAGKVGPSIAGIRSVLEQGQLNPGTTLYARLLNKGSSWVEYPPHIRIERFTGSQWVKDPASPSGGHKILYLLKPKRASRCFQFAIPDEQPAGKYRIVTFVLAQNGWSRRFVVFWVQPEAM